MTKVSWCLLDSYIDLFFIWILKTNQFILCLNLWRQIKKVLFNCKRDKRLLVQYYEIVEMAARSIWKGAISFGLVNIPIEIFSAVQKEVYTSFNQLCENGHKIKNRKWCPIEEREIQWSEIKKGYEIAKNNYVVIEKGDLEKIKLKTTNTIEVKDFIELEEFDPLFIEKITMLDLTLARKRRATTLLLLLLLLLFQQKLILCLSRY